MTTSLKTVIIHILANNSQSKDKQIKKSDQLMKYTNKHIFLLKSGRKDRETSSRPIFVFLKAIFQLKVILIYYSSPKLNIQ